MRFNSMGMGNGWGTEGTTLDERSLGGIWRRGDVMETATLLEGWEGHDS